MVRIRLRRVGAKKQPHYRVVVADQRAPRDGRHIETIGYYNPRTEPETVKIKEDRALYWLSKGAQPSDVVRHMLEKQGTLARLNRFKAGEPLEALVAEFEAGFAEEVSAEPVEVEPMEPVAAVDTEVSEAEASEAEAQMAEVEVAAEAGTDAPEADLEEVEMDAPEADLEEVETDEATADEE